MTPGTDVSTSLLLLNEDVLCKILELLLHAGGLNEFSQTSRQVRAACMPVLFRRCFCPVEFRPPGPQMFLPSSAWPHVQYLMVRDDCLDKFNPDSTLCFVLGGPLVDQWLQGMPRLHSVTLYQCGEEPHGLSWRALQSVLSLPVIREFKLDQLHFCPELLPSDELRIEPTGHLTSFEYLLRKRADPYYIESPYTAQPNYNDEMRALSITLAALQETLERLTLATESAPIHLFAQHPWPRLRRLALRGEPSDSLLLSLLSSVSHLPHLQSLVLKFSSTKDIPVRTGIIWRGAHTDPFPCPVLEELVVTYPDPADPLFDHLPPTLRTLSLCCWRHLYHEYLSPYRQWDPSDAPRPLLLLSSSEMHEVLRRSRTTMLRHLTLEYRANDGDDELLQYIAQNYPLLTRLKLIRYRPAGVDDVPIERIARLLRPLAHLSELKIHLDHPDMPLPGLALMLGAGGMYSRSAMDQFRLIVDEVADVFARELSSSMNILSIFTPTARRWARFRAVYGKALQEEE
ncbi:hypothetical protein OH76DRAFT_1407147 [Lentinus brumalis]|uniref:F-box domain-containing protein n=1 Tax=Lentinus brumalis TaxID=2498619 RepID=A0A371D183_9APHY|nr:hypothetical protein OH76DRAFT_1407147 [Polyporus brumalis]